MYSPSTLCRLACLVALSGSITFSTLAHAQPKTAEERKALQEQKRAEVEAKRNAQLEKRKQAEEERLAKAELQKAIQPRDYDFAEAQLKFKSVLGWKETTEGTAVDGQLVAMDLIPTGPVKAPDGQPAVALPRYTIQSIKLPEGTSVEEFVDYTNKSLLADPNLNIVPPKETTIGDDNTKAYTIVARSKPSPERPPTTLRRLIATRQGKGLVFQIISPTHLFSRAIAGAEQMEKSVTFGAGAATQPAVEDADSVLRVYPEADFAIRRPNSWTHRDDLVAPGLLGAFYLDATANTPGNLAEQLMFITDADFKPTDTDSKAYLERLLKANLSMHKDATHTAIEERFIDSKVAASAMASFEVGGFKQKQLFIAVHRGSDAVNIIYIADEAEFDKFLPDVQKAIETIKLSPSEPTDLPEPQ